MTDRLTGALMGALNDVAAQLNGGTFGQVDLDIFGDSFRGVDDAIITYLSEQTGGRVFRGDSRLFANRWGPGVYIVFVPSLDPHNPLRPEYQPGAKCLMIAPTSWGLYDAGGPADKARLKAVAPDGLPADYVLPDEVK